MIAFLQRLIAALYRTPKLPAARSTVLLRVEGLEARDTPAPLLSAFAGLDVAASHFFPPQPIQPALVAAPVFALNFNYPPNPCTPLPALEGAFAHHPPTPIHSPVLLGVELFLNGGGSPT